MKAAIIIVAALLAGCNTQELGRRMVNASIAGQAAGGLYYPPAQPIQSQRCYYRQWGGQVIRQCW